MNQTKGFHAPVSESKPKEVVPSGNHIATCYQVIDLGTIEGQWEGQPTFKRKVRLTFELPNELRVFNPDNGKQPMVISREFTLSMHENSVLRPFIQSWIGKTMNDDDARKFDISSLCGMSGLLNIIHASKDGKTYANISTMTPLIAGMPAPAPINPQTIIFLDDFENFNWDGYNDLPEFMQKKVAESPEWNHLQNWMATKASSLATPPSAPSAPVTNQTQEDDLPF
jgi:hypothetical protein